MPSPARVNAHSDFLLVSVSSRSKDYRRPE